MSRPPYAHARTPEGEPLRVGRFALRVALFVLGVALCLALLGRFDRLADVAVVGEKLEHLATSGEDYDTLFVGSSAVYRGISPRAYEAELAASGISAHAFNCGVLGMVPPESYYFLDRVLAARPASLRWVYLELAPFQKRVKRTHTRRFDYWHTLEYTGIVLDSVRATAWAPEAKLSQAAIHLEAFARRTFQVGQGRALGAALLAPLFPPVPDAGCLGPDGDGWLSTEDDSSNRMELRREEQTELDDVLGSRTDMLRGGGRQRENPVALAALARAVARVRAAGATPILLVLPTLEKRSLTVDLTGVELDAERMAFDDPERYPELFAPENRFDLGHMNKPGAAVLARAIAARFAERRPR